MADPAEYEYHGDECSFCQSMILDVGKTLDPISGEQGLDNMFFFGPALDALLAARSSCPLAKALYEDWSESYTRSYELFEYRRMPGRSTRISLCGWGLEASAQSIQEMLICLWDSKKRRQVVSDRFHVLTTDGQCIYHMNTLTCLITNLNSTIKTTSLPRPSPQGPSIGTLVPKQPLCLHDAG